MKSHVKTPSFKFTLKAALFVFTFVAFSTNCKKQNYPVAEKGCTYVLDKENITLEWTAFKFTKKAGVKGSFSKTDFVLPGEKSDPASALDGLTFTIDATSVSTGNPGRDEKIKNTFFGKIENAESISGRVFLKDSVLTTTLLYNGLEKELNSTWNFENDQVYLSTVIDNFQWNGNSAVEALNEACYTEHTGEDNISKLWPDVEIKVTATVIKTCNE